MGNLTRAFKPIVIGRYNSSSCRKQQGMSVSDPYVFLVIKIPTYSIKQRYTKIAPVFFGGVLC